MPGLGTYQLDWTCPAATGETYAKQPDRKQDEGTGFWDAGRDRVVHPDRDRVANAIGAGGRVGRARIYLNTRREANSFLL